MSDREDRPPDVPYNAANPLHVAHMADVDERFEKERLGAIRTVLRDYAGRRTFWDLLVTSGITRSIYVTDALDMAFRAGQQNLGHKLQADLLAVDESLYDQMAREARARAKTEAVVRQAVLARLPDEE